MLSITFNSSKKQKNSPILLTYHPPSFSSPSLDFITSTPGLYFNSIRKQQITVKIQASSDAIIRFSSEPDGSGSNFEVRLGVEGNMESCIFESDVRRTCSTTPGLLNISQMRTFNISWNGGSVFVVHENPILFHFLSYPFAVRFVGVGTIRWDFLCEF